MLGRPPPGQNLDYHWEAACGIGYRLSEIQAKWKLDGEIFEMLFLGCCARFHIRQIFPSQYIHVYPISIGEIDKISYFHSRFSTIFSPWWGL